MKYVLIIDLLNEKLDVESDIAKKKQIKALINKLRSFAHTPISAKHALRMLPFSENEVIYNIVLDIIKDYKIWELYSRDGNRKCVRMYDAKSYWYLIALILCNLSEKGEEQLLEIIQNIDVQMDYTLMLRTLDFFDDNSRVLFLKAELQARESTNILF